MSSTRTLARRGRRIRWTWLSGLTGSPMRRRRLRFTPRAQLAAALTVLVGGLLFGAWLWLRDSSLVAVNRVTIAGVIGTDAGAIRSALRSAARNMTTLDVQMGQLRTAVAPFPEVRRLEVRTAFPHQMVIVVIEERPVAVVQSGGRAVPVAADGTLLRSVTVSSSLPTISLSVPPVGKRLAEGRAADLVGLLAAAPDQLLPRISQASIVGGHGLVAQLRGGPSIYFGAAGDLAAKWTAATEVLADPGSAGASYIDVTDASRPVAGADGGPSAAAATTPTTTTPAPSPGASAGGTGG